LKLSYVIIKQFSMIKMSHQHFMTGSLPFRFRGSRTDSGLFFENMLKHITNDKHLHD
jgi:hypothetical protein